MIIPVLIVAAASTLGEPFPEGPHQLQAVVPCRGERCLVVELCRAVGRCQVGLCLEVQSREAPSQEAPSQELPPLVDPAGHTAERCNKGIQGIGHMPGSCHRSRGTRSRGIVHTLAVALALALQPGGTDPSCLLSLPPSLPPVGPRHLVLLLPVRASVPLQPHSAPAPPRPGLAAGHSQGIVAGRSNPGSNRLGLRMAGSSRMGNRRTDWGDSPVFAPVAHLLLLGLPSGSRFRFLRVQLGDQFQTNSLFWSAHFCPPPSPWSLGYGNLWSLASSESSPHPFQSVARPCPVGSVQSC
mmetsp:Transcript_36505/g.67443  ORF Transcript_36505/g.67443 Transcript_36505/m.67443 type:complete len:297 (+) Transcript_36505:93-983(+)